MSWNRNPSADGARRAAHLGGGALLAAILLAGAPAAHAVDVTFAWDASASPDVVGYTVHHGLASGGYETAVDVGTATSWTFAGLEDGVPHYFAVSARDRFGQEGPLSAEAVYGAGGGTDVQPVFVDTFADGGRGGDPDWRPERGKWKVDRKKRLRASMGRDNLALVDDPQLQDFSSGRIEADVSLASRPGTRPNAYVVFHHDGLGGYSYLRLTPKSVILSQASVPGGIGFRLGRRVKVRVNRWHRLRLDIDPAGQLTVYLNDMENPVLVAQLPSAAGAVGFRVRKAATLFDNVAIWDDAVLP